MMFQVTKDINDKLHNLRIQTPDRFPYLNELIHKSFITDFQPYALIIFSRTFIDILPHSSTINSPLYI
jgi:hypothetical protein